MGVYVKSVGMPTKCDECPFRAMAIAYCTVIKQSTSHYPSGKPRDESIRPKECPLVEVKTPHGDLADRKKVAEIVTTINRCRNISNRTLAIALTEATVIEEEK